MTSDREMTITYSGEDLEILSSLSRYQDWILDGFAPYIRGRTVEIGAGTGNFTRRLTGLVETLDVVEPSPNLHAHLATTFENPAISAHCQTAEQWLAEQRPASRETIVMINVLEHIEDDVAVLKAFREILVPGGHLLLFVPAMMALFSKLDAIHGHFRRYGRTELRRKVSDAGFTLLETRYMDVLGTLPWLILNKWMGRIDFDQRMVALYDRVGVPVTRAVEGVMDFPFGKNVFLVARRD